MRGRDFKAEKETSMLGIGDTKIRNLVVFLDGINLLIGIAHKWEREIHTDGVGVERGGFQHPGGGREGLCICI
jgi:hypothetical protein